MSQPNVAYFANGPKRFVYRNVSGRAADIVADTENLIFNTTLVRNVTDQAVEDTRSTASVVRACAIEVLMLTIDCMCIL